MTPAAIGELLADRLEADVAVLARTTDAATVARYLSGVRVWLELATVLAVAGVTMTPGVVLHDGPERSPAPVVTDVFVDGLAEDTANARRIVARGPLERETLRRREANRHALRGGSVEERRPAHGSDDTRRAPPANPDSGASDALARTVVRFHDSL